MVGSKVSVCSGSIFLQRLVPQWRLSPNGPGMRRLRLSEAYNGSALREPEQDEAVRSFTTLQPESGAQESRFEGDDYFRRLSEQLYG